MRHYLSSIAIINALQWVLTCGPETRTSLPHGHFEETTANEVISAQLLKPRAIPEYHRSATVIVSSDLIRNDGYQNTSIPLAILEAKARLLVVASPFEQDGLDGPGYEDARQVLDAHGFEISFLPLAGTMSPSTWARDWSPISARGSKGEEILLDFKISALGQNC
jgi:hypothetical protein